MSGRDAWAAWAGVRRFNRETRGEALAFYAEAASDWSYLGPLVEAVASETGRRVAYLASAADDPVLADGYGLADAYFIGSGSARTYLFQTLRARLLVLTMPDLETFHLKRSRASHVWYVYAFHSLVSTHMVYRTGAFDSYDTILAVGGHHVREIRATERVNGLPAKQILETGYPRLDGIMAAARQQNYFRSGGGTRVLVAPSWGPRGMIETGAESIVRSLLTAGCRVTVRPHPMTLRKAPARVQALRNDFARDSAFHLETDIRCFETFHDSDIMVSDWSGAALEFAFGLERPVLYVELPRKINNPEYERIHIVPLEAEVRGELGAVLAPDRLDDVGRMAVDLAGKRDQLRPAISRARERTVFNLGRSAAVAGRQLAELYAARLGGPADDPDRISA